MAAFTSGAAGYSGALAAAAAVLAACTSVNAGSETFEGTRWQVTAINGQSMPHTESYRIEFTQGRIGGRFGCNQFGGPYRVSSDLLITSDIASTLMGCPEPAASHEAQGFAVLRQPMRLEWKSGLRVALVNAAGSIALERLD